MQKIKKSLALILALMICITALPFSALTVSAESIKIGYISGEDVNIRKDATTTSDKAATVTKWTVEILDKKNDRNVAFAISCNCDYFILILRQGVKQKIFLARTQLKVLEYLIRMRFSSAS
jgi:hypothetical protein